LPGPRAPRAARAGDRADPVLRAGRPPAEDPRRAVGAARRGQGVPDRRRRPRPEVRAAAVRRGNPGGGRCHGAGEEAAAGDARRGGRALPGGVAVSVAGLGRLSRTVTKLRPAQAGQRVRLRAQRAALERGIPLAARWLLAGPDAAAPAGWPAGFTPLDALLW